MMGWAFLVKLYNSMLKFPGINYRKLIYGSLLYFFSKLRFLFRLFSYPMKTSQRMCFMQMCYLKNISMNFIQGLKWWEYDPRMLSAVACAYFHFLFLLPLSVTVLWSSCSVGSRCTDSLVQLDLFTFISLFLCVMHTCICTLRGGVPWRSTLSSSFIEHHWLCVYLCKQPGFTFWMYPNDWDLFWFSCAVWECLW